MATESTEEHGKTDFTAETTIAGEGETRGPVEKPAWAVQEIEQYRSNCRRTQRKILIEKQSNGVG